MAGGQRWRVSALLGFLGSVYCQMEGDALSRPWILSRAALHVQAPGRVWGLHAYLPTLVPPLVVVTDVNVDSPSAPCLPTQQLSAAVGRRQKSARSAHVSGDL